MQVTLVTVALLTCSNVFMLWAGLCLLGAVYFMFRS